MHHDVNLEKRSFLLVVKILFAVICLQNKQKVTSFILYESCNFSGANSFFKLKDESDHTTLNNKKYFDKKNCFCVSINTLV